MKKTATFVLVLVVLASTACSPSSLSDEEATWCREEMTRLELVDKGQEIGVDIAYVFDRGQEIFDSFSEEGGFDEALDAAMEYTENEPDFIKVCKAAYEGR